MVVRKSYRRFAAVVVAGLAASGAASPAFAQAGTPEGVVPGSQEHVQSLLDQYAPGVKLDALNLPKNAFRGGNSTAMGGLGMGAASPFHTAAAAGSSMQAGSASADAARARAQAILNQYAPGVTLGEQGVRVEMPGGPVVDTRPGAAAVEPAEALHRMAVEESLRALRAGEYRRSALWIEPVAADRPQDGDVRQLESLALLSDGQAAAAADAAKAALKAGSAWDRARLRSILPNYDDLGGMLRRAAQQNPEDGKVLFLLAYHELMLGRSEDALRTLDQAAEHLPEGWLPAAVRARFEE